MVIPIGSCPHCGHEVELPDEPPVRHETTCRNCGHVIMERDPQRDGGRFGLVVGLLFFGAIIAVCSGVAWNMSAEEVTSISMGDGLTATIYAEGQVHYEPPGFLSIEVHQHGRELVPRFKYIGIGAERVPNEKYVSWRCESTDVAALAHGTDVQFMLDLRDGRTWPPARWTLYDCKPDIGSELLGRLRTCHTELTCERLDGLIEFLERERRLERTTP